MNVTEVRLSDGRELFYVDEGVRVRGEVDRRGLVWEPPASQVRYDPLQDEWVVIASHRQARTHLPEAAECPLCPSTPTRMTEIPAADYDVVVFENRFPSLATAVAPVSPSPYIGAGPGDAAVGEPMRPARPGLGRCEVVCFSSKHDVSFADLPPERVRTIVDVWAERTAALGAIEGVEQVFPFENRGEEIGVTLSHPHGQIYAYPFVTPRTRRALEAAERHRTATGGNLFADVLAAEQRAGTRVVRRTAHWTAFVPHAARWPVEVHLYPNRRVPDLPALNGEERDDFAEVYLDILARLDGLYGVRMPYVAAWHQAPVRTGRDAAYLRLELFSSRRAPGKLKYLAGSESGMGVFINDVLPERYAELLRQARA